MSEGRRAANLIIVNAAIHTMDGDVPRARALAVGGRILAMGEGAAMRSLAGPGARIIDAGGRLVLPGFQDTHIHLQDSGAGFAGSADLARARSIVELQRILRDFAASRPADGWVNGVGWYSGIFGEHNLDRSVLDDAVAGRPVHIVASDGHSAAVNSAACRLLGLDAGTPDPANGRFVRDARGAPTGLLHGAALDWVRARLPALTDAEWAAGVRHGQRKCNRHGITGVVDALVQRRNRRAQLHGRCGGFRLAQRRHGLARTG